MVEGTIGLAQRWTAVFEGHADAADEIIADNCVFHDFPPGTPNGPDGVRQAAEALRTAFPDVHPVDEQFLAEGDRVMAHYVLRGTHRGPFMGVAPTGKEVRITGINVFRVVGGKVAEHWTIMDTWGVMQQIGAVPR